MNRYIQYMYSYPHKTAYRGLEKADLRDYVDNLAGNGHSLYLHIPFCESKCGYCNLFSVTGMERDFFEKYTEAVERQIQQYSELLPGDTVFEDITMGGGTPLLLPEELLRRLFTAMREQLPVKGNCEIIIETAPKQTTPEKVKLLKELGVTRVSMGVQSFDNEELRWLRRSHSGESAKVAAGLLQQEGFPCFNLDFIYGIPFQTEESLLKSLRIALTYEPEEIFLYPLYIKHGVKLLEEKAVPDPEHTFRLYQCGRDFLKKNGYVQNSMRRLTKCENKVFVECGMKSSLSLGCGGRSYLGNLHTCTPYQISRCSALEELERFLETEDFTKFSNGILLDEEEIKRRYVIKHGFCLPGISMLRYQELFGSELLQDFPVFAEWRQQGYVVEADGMLALTEDGMGMSDWLGPQLISEKIRELMLAWEREHGAGYFM